MELPIAFEFAEKYKDIIEIGNVTRHYHREYTHDVIDLFEKSKWPIWNEDVLTFTPPKKYSAALSVSTVEHTLDPVGAIKKITQFAPKYLITMPMGYSSNNGVLKLDLPMYFMHRIGTVEENHWEQTTKKEALKAEYGSPYPFANVVVFITNEPS